MKTKNNWIIIDVVNSTAIHGINNITMRFSTREVAREIAEQLFGKNQDYIIVEIKTEK